MVELIDSGRTDIAIGPQPTSTEAHVEVFGQEEVVVVAAAGHRFAQLTAVSLPEIANEPFVHYDPDNGLASAKAMMSTRRAASWAGVGSAATGNGAGTRTTTAVPVEGDEGRPVREIAENHRPVPATAPTGRRPGGEATSRPFAQTPWRCVMRRNR